MTSSRTTTSIYIAARIRVKVVFRCFFKKSHFIQVIHGNFGQTHNLGARIQLQLGKNLQKSSVESTLCHWRRCYGPPSPHLVGGCGGDCWGAKQNKNLQQKCCVFIGQLSDSQTSKHFFTLNKRCSILYLDIKNVNKIKIQLFFEKSYGLFCQV